MIEKFREMTSEKKTVVIVAFFVGLIFALYLLTQFLSATIEGAETQIDVSDNPTTSNQETVAPEIENVEPTVTVGRLGEDDICYDEQNNIIDRSLCPTEDNLMHDESDINYDFDFNFIDTAAVFAQKVCPKQYNESFEEVYARVSPGEKLMTTLEQYRGLIFKKEIQTLCEPLSVNIMSDDEELYRIKYIMTVIVTGAPGANIKEFITVNYNIDVKKNDETYSVSKAETTNWKFYME